MNTIRNFQIERKNIAVVSHFYAKVFFSLFLIINTHFKQASIYIYSTYLLLFTGFRSFITWLLWVKFLLRHSSSMEYNKPCSFTVRLHFIFITPGLNSRSQGSGVSRDSVSQFHLNTFANWSVSSCWAQPTLMGLKGCGRNWACKTL